MRYIYKLTLKTIFGDCRIVALAGIKNSGKTNNLCYVLSQLTKAQLKRTYFYGMPKDVAEWLIEKGCREIDNINQVVDKQGSLFIFDEFQKLKLNDRRNRHVLAKVVDFIYHNKNYLLLSSPNIREFNTVIGGVIERWLLKTIKIDQCVNGSQLKKVVEDYQGAYKQINDIIVPQNELIVVNDVEKLVVKCKYVKYADSKKNSNIKEFF